MVEQLSDLFAWIVQLIVGSDPFFWVIPWIIGVVWLAGKTQLVFVRLACAAAAAVPFGFLIYHHSRSIGFAITIGLVVFVALAFKLIVFEVLGRLIKRDQEKGKASGLDCSLEFQRRRRKAWRYARFGLALVVISLLVLSWESSFENEAMIGLVGGVIWLILVCFWCYGCPNCGIMLIWSVSSVGRGDVRWDVGTILDPEFCSACGARLKAISTE